MNGRFMYWVRIDNRLIHGQVIEAWLPFTKARTLVVSNDELARDALRQEIMGLAIPQGVDARFVPVAETPSFLKSHWGAGMEPNALILFATCKDARIAHQGGMAMSRLNVGNLHYAPGKKQICAHVALSDDDRNCLHYFMDSGVKLDFRCVPNEPVQVEQAW